MSLKNLITTIIVAVAASLGVGTFVFTSQDATVGGNYNLTQQYFGAGIRVGPTQKLLSNFTFGTCDLVGPTTIPATSTRDFACTATGVKSGDVVQISAPATQANGFTVLGASASTTNGFITVRMQNASTTGTTLPVNSTSSFQWEAFR